jgi:hypothetical protein
MKTQSRKNSKNMAQNTAKTLLFLGITILTGISMSTAHAFADDSGTNPTTGIDVVRGAVQQLEDELARRGSQTQLNSDDYKAWNKQFQASLNQALDEYEQGLETGVATKLQPLTDRYNMISNQTELRGDQINALKAVTLQQLQTQATALSSAQEGLFRDLFNKVFTFFPVPNAKRLGTKIHSVNIFGDGPWTKQSYQVGMSTIGASTVSPTTKTCSMDDTDGNNNPDTWGQEQLWSFAARCTEKAVYDNDQFVGSANLTGTDLQSTFQHFIVPVLKDGCQSQVCMTLKQEDISLVLDTLSKTVDQPFVVLFSDYEKVSLAITPLDITMVDALLSNTYVDPTLPFNIGSN